MDYQGKKSSLLITLRTLNFSHLSIFPFCRGCRTIILQLMILAFQLIQQFWHFQANHRLKITQKSNGLLGYFAVITLFGSNSLQNVQNLMLFLKFSLYSVLNPNDAFHSCQRSRQKRLVQFCTKRKTGNPSEPHQDPLTNSRILLLLHLYFQGGFS